MTLSFDTYSAATSGIDTRRISVTGANGQVSALQQRSSEYAVFMMLMVLVIVTERRVLSSRQVAEAAQEQKRSSKEPQEMLSHAERVSFRQTTCKKVDATTNDTVKGSSKDEAMKGDYLRRRQEKTDS